MTSKTSYYKTMYNYDNKLVLRKKKPYEYSPETGEIFYQSWLEKRNKYIKNFKTEEGSIKIFFKKYKCLNKTIRQIIKIKNDLVSFFYLIYKFEICNKLFIEYSADFKKVIIKKENINLYIIFAYYLCIFYEKYKFLQILNCLLKVNDKILSKKKLTNIQESIMGIILKKEQIYVKTLDNEI